MGLRECGSTLKLSNLQEGVVDGECSSLPVYRDMETARSRYKKRTKDENAQRRLIAEHICQAFTDKCENGRESHIAYSVLDMKKADRQKLTDRIWNNRAMDVVTMKAQEKKVADLLKSMTLRRWMTKPKAAATQRVAAVVAMIAVSATPPPSSVETFAAVCSASLVILGMASAVCTTPS